MLYIEFERSDQEILAQLRRLRENIDNWNDQRQRVEFMGQVCPYLDIPDEGQDENQARLRDQDVLGHVQIEILLTDAVSYDGSLWSKRDRERFISRVAGSGYTVEPALDAHGQPVRLRTTALHYLGRLTDPQAHRKLVDPLFTIYKKYEVNYEDEYGYTHFHALCATGSHFHLQEWLFKRDPAVHASLRVRETKDTPLHLAMRLAFSDGTMAEMLLLWGADPDPRNRRGDTALHLACKRERDAHEHAKRFLAACKTDHTRGRLDARDAGGHTPLHLALCHKTEAIKLTELLLRAGADPNRCDLARNAPLHYVCSRRNGHSLLRVFIVICDEKKRRVEYDPRDREKRTPLQWAVATCAPRTVEMLLDRGARLDGFVFPKLSFFDLAFSRWDKKQWFSYQMDPVLGARDVLDILESRGYETRLGDALTIMSFFDKNGLIEKSTTPQVDWKNDADFVEGTRWTTITALKDTFYDLLQLGPEEAAKVFTRACSSNVWISGRLSQLPRASLRACAAHLRETVSRRFFEKWSHASLWLLMQCTLTVYSYNRIVEPLTNADVYNICLAAASRGS